MQSQKFPEELAYLRGPVGRMIPARVVSMNLFLDPQGIIRSDGRLGRASYYDYETINPILLPRDHPLTVFIIRDYHLVYLIQYPLSIKQIMFTLWLILENSIIYSNLLFPYLNCTSVKCVYIYIFKTFINYLLCSANSIFHFCLVVGNL